MKKILLLKILFKQNIRWVSATIIGIVIVLGFCLSAVPFVVKLPSSSFESTIDWEYSAYDKYANVVFSHYFKKGTFNFITENLLTLGYFTIINSIFVIKYNFKLKNIYQIKRLNNLISSNKLNYIPLIVSGSLFLVTLLSFLVFDIFFINIIVAQKKDYLSLQINKLWLQEVKNLLNSILHYIFVLGICYLIIDLAKYRISKFVSLKLIFIILSIILIIPFILNTINQSLVDSNGSFLNKILDLFRFVLNPFDEWYLFYIGSAKEYMRNFSFENIEQIYQVLRIIYSLVALSYIIYNFKANRGKYE
ncbi:hypothetical protein HUN03_00106 [Mycoplasmopsis anatis]|uniref:hypothetical protein n=1 Tax=Mycoplasmopsis anatis TaxID=171279 RepID=UPI001C4DF968|nr:hypothetical protein [Mycoplasmopsis anatis]MBW0594899.1 hypothetical protein [Mycoplasmopsis anatis]MBW0595664.1 hypothetical protein [Mycoplasmopsis anatis]MBW0598610.1 hypothetical protein [Mycoplasmopsis anatis]MBW0599258.1 hypothetical protein [Mycoplasmopsis anatis]MBW0601472.1 hypothetical protein [Mycoplasmopsis anatis]